MGRLTHLGESFPFYFDSGTDCSLIKESVALKFFGKRMTNTVVMRGIGDTSIKYTLEISSALH